jgi:hypothetical protein
MVRLGPASHVLPELVPFLATAVAKGAGVGLRLAAEIVYVRSAPKRREGGLRHRRHGVLRIAVRRSPQTCRLRNGPGANGSVTGHGLLAWWMSWRTPGNIGRVMEHSAAQDLHLRMPKSVRAFGLLLLVGWSVGVVASLATEAGGALLFGAFAALGIVSLRTSVDTDSDGVTISGGFRKRTLRWRDVESFRVLKARLEGSGPGVFALLAGGEMVKLPLPLGGGLFATSRRMKRLTEMHAILEALRQERGSE